MRCWVDALLSPRAAALLARFTHSPTSSRFQIPCVATVAKAGGWIALFVTCGSVGEARPATPVWLAALRQSGREPGRVHRQRGQHPQCHLITQCPFDFVLGF